MPPKKPTHHSENGVRHVRSTGVSLTHEMWRVLDAMAEEEERDRSWVIESLLRAAPEVQEMAAALEIKLTKRTRRGGAQPGAGRPRTKEGGK